MTEIVGGVLMAVGGGMLSVSSIRLLVDPRPSVSAGVLASLRDTPVPSRTPADMHELLGRLD